MPTTEQIIEALRPVEDPELRRSIVDLGMVRDVELRTRRHASACWSPSPCRAARCASEIEHRVSSARAPARGRDGRRARLHGDDRRGARGAAHPPPRRPGGQRRRHRGPRPRRGPADPVRPARLADPAAAHRVRQGRCRQVQRHDQPRRRPRPAGPLGGRHRRRRVRLLDPPHARHRPRAGRDRPDARATGAVGRPLHLDGLLRARGPGRHLARPDAAQGAGAVPHRRLLGRSRLPAGRHAARHRRHRAQPQPVPAPCARCSSSPRPSPRPRRWPGCPRRWPRRCTSPCGA